MAHQGSYKLEVQLQICKRSQKGRESSRCSLNKEISTKSIEKERGGLLTFREFYRIHTYLIDATSPTYCLLFFVYSDTSKMNPHANLRRVVASQPAGQHRYHYATPYLNVPLAMTEQQPPPLPSPQAYTQPQHQNQPQPQQAPRNVSPAELTDTEILLQHGYADIWYLMTARGLNPYHQPDIELAKQMIGTMRAATQRVWDRRAWEVMMGTMQEARVPGQKSIGVFERMREEWWHSQMEWAHWDREQDERERRMEHEVKVKREGGRGRRR
ncbi:hypothetical protein B0J14DRAFT_640922 [Halenospora varia]|nr:hypothetical protein B0J14DRAFT_640922 [Halenospora varia]